MSDYVEHLISLAGGDGDEPKPVIVTLAHAEGTEPFAYIDPSKQP